MTYENDIPEYALQPARAPKITEAEAIYHGEKVVCPAEEQTVIYQFEEDILVPDTKPDMGEILLMDAWADIMPAEKKISPKTDDLLNIMGTITLQTLYKAEAETEDPVAITSKVPYKYQWSLNPADQAQGIFDCRVKALEFMMINERKFRVKISLAFSGQLFCEREFQFFAGLKDDELEMKRAQTSMTCLELMKQDEVTINETFRGKDAALQPEYILKQDFVITENYRQVTTEKVVLNGFVFVSLLYAASGADGEAGGGICQHNQRIEFTQFVPIDKEHRGKSWNAVRASFCGRDLAVVIERNEENPEEVYFRIRGDVETRVELYAQRKQETIVDAYHREKHFRCDFSHRQVENLIGGAMTEIPIREIVNLPEGTKAAEAVYCNAAIPDWSCSCETGKIVVSGTVGCHALWKDQAGSFHTASSVPDFRGIVDMEHSDRRIKATCKPVVKTAWVELINEKQIEINGTILLCVETSREEEVTLLENPAFVHKAKTREYPMVIVTKGKGETLWDLAKRYRTTEAGICSANGLEEEPDDGRKLLIVK